MTIQDKVTAIEAAILDAEAFVGSIEDDQTRDAAIVALGSLHDHAAKVYKAFKAATTHNDETQALRTPADDKD